MPFEFPRTDLDTSGARPVCGGGLLKIASLTLAERHLYLAPSQVSGGKEALCSVPLPALDLVMTLRNPQAGNGAQKGGDRFLKGSSYLSPALAETFDLRGSALCLSSCHGPVCHLAWLLPLFVWDTFRYPSVRRSPWK